jgi:hypothetical protein
MRRAYVVGSNGPFEFGTVAQLRFALIDADRVTKCLSSPLCGFQVEAPAVGMRPKDIVEAIEAICEKSTPSDAVVCFFSGHGILDARGNLLLLWDQSDPAQLLTTTISIKKIMDALEGCEAKNKLLILDCCHAGAVVNMSGFKGAAEVSLRDAIVPPDNYAIIMAGGRADRARELPFRRAGFLTDTFCQALSDKMKDADSDGDRRISIGDITKWLTTCAANHNVEFPDYKVPYPSVFGKYRDFFLTLSLEDWTPWEVRWPDGSTMVVVPVRDAKRPDLAMCLSKYPITNIQYKALTDEGRGVVPTGESFEENGTSPRRGVWKGPFLPWWESSFNGDTNPVVCVSYHDALDYCKWVTERWRQLTVLPTAQLWDYGAFGTIYPTRDPRQWLRAANFHHKSKYTVAVENSNERTNAFGLADMIGNVWEWCVVERRDYAVLGPMPKAALRGGGFLDDLYEVEPFLEASTLTEGTNTRHSDLGFRIAGAVPIRSLPESVRAALDLTEAVPGLLEGAHVPPW